MNDEQQGTERGAGREIAPDVAGEGTIEQSRTALPDGPVLVVAAHPDDADIGCGGTMARLIAEGRTVAVAVVTDGTEGGEDPLLPDDQLRDTREAEQRAALLEVGVVDVHFLRFPDGRLEQSLQLRLELTRLIRQTRPATVFAHDPTAHLFEGYINHPDHRVSGAATLDAVFPAAGNPRSFRQLLSEGLAAHKVNCVFLFYTANANAWIDISGSPLERKIDALSRHGSQLGPDWDGAAWLREQAEAEGKSIGLAAAEGFRRIDLGH